MIRRIEDENVRSGTVYLMKEKYMSQTKKADEVLISFHVTPERVRLLANKDAKRDLSTIAAQNFLDIYKEDIDQVLAQALASFVRSKF